MIPDEIPKEMQDLIDDLKEAKSKEVALRKAYDVLVKLYPGSRWTFLAPWRWFTGNLYQVWNERKRIPSTTMNLLLTILLVKSGWFTEDQIEEKWSPFWPHEYVIVSYDGESLAIDLWGAAHGVPFGEHA